MITDRDDEFRATITFFYRQELGRDPDPGGMDAHLEFCRNGGTGEQLQQALHDSAEGVAYRSRPPAPPPAKTPRVFAAGLSFTTADGQPWRMAFLDGFRDYERFLRGEDLRPLLQETIELGANGRRVLGAFDFGTPEAQRLYPAEHPDYYDRLPAFFALYAEFGLYVQFCVFADTKRSVPGRDAQLAHWGRVMAILPGVPNVLGQRVNENDQHENGVDADVPKPDGVCCSFGSNGTGNDPPEPFWDYADLGSERREGRMPLSTTTVYFAKFGYSREGRGPDFPGARRPTVVSEPPKLGVHITTLDDAFTLGLGCQYGNGGTAHTQAGLMSVLLPGDVKELARAFIRGVKAA